MEKLDPFATETIQLYVPLEMGERRVTKLSLKPPVFGDLLRTDKHPAGSHAADLALLSALSGEPEEILKKLVPEDTAVCRIALSRAYQRFFSAINLFEEKEDERTDPPGAERPPTM